MRSMVYRFSGWIVLLLFSLVLANGQYTNQHAYFSSGLKNIFLESKFENKTFKVLDSQDKVVFTGKTTIVKTWKPSGTSVCIADVSPLIQPGTYTLKLNDLKFSFRISEDAYKEVGEKILKSFYMARVSEPVLEKHAGIYAREAGHPDDKVFVHASAATVKRPEGHVISSPGGWYDAGDYNKYIVNSAISVYTLLHTYELFGEHLGTLNINIPESENKQSDLLDETFINLEWMKTMQDPDDGGVYHKLTSLTFCGMIMPEHDKLPRYVVSKSTAASLDYAATMAKASRIFKSMGDEYIELSEIYLKSAIQAYGWAILNPDHYFTNPPDVKTGAYDDQDLSDEWYWASMELFLCTGDKIYLQRINTDEQEFAVPEWRRTNLMGIYSAMQNKTYLHLLGGEKIEKKLMEIADQKFGVFENAAFSIPIEKFPWGSNSEVLNDGLVLLYAYIYSGNQKYLDAADACANYVLGANPLDKCFVTGFGTNAVRFPHDRRCSADGIAEPIPGLVIGGPTKDARGDCGENNYNSGFPGLSYLDKECSYSTNETAINWNSAGAALFLGLDVVHKHLKK